MESKLTQAEGFILGVSAKMFTIANPFCVRSICPKLAGKKILALIN